MVPILETQELSHSFGALQVARHIAFRLLPGARHALIGPNGAGKTTFLNLLTGAIRPTAGRILLAGTDVTALPPEARVKLGLARTFQINQLFRSLTVIENVAIAVTERLGLGSHWRRAAGRHPELLAEVERILRLLRLEEDAGRRIAELAYGRQRLVELALGLALSPRVLLLDEPAAGIPGAEYHVFLDAIASLPREIAVLIIDHDMDLVFRFAERITVMVEGAIFAEGTPAEIAADARVRDVYLGGARGG